MGVVSKTVGVIMTLFLTVILGVMTYAMTSTIALQRSVFNEMEIFVAKTCDSGTITDLDLAEFKTAVNVYGVVMKADVTHFVKYHVPQGVNSSVVNYSAVDLKFEPFENGKRVKLNKGDIVKVRVRAVEQSGAIKMLFNLTKVFIPDFDYTISGSVRN